MTNFSTNSSPFDAESSSAASSKRERRAGAGQFSLRTAGLITFDIAFILAWWSNSVSHTRLGEEMGEYSQRVIFSTLRIGLFSFPVWTFLFAFLPALAGASLGSCAYPDLTTRRRLRGASLFYTLLSAVIIESCVRLAMFALHPDSDAQLLLFAFGNLGWGGLTLLVYGFWLLTIAASYGLLISLILSLLARWKMIYLAAPWHDAPWKAMWIAGLYGPYVWLVGFLIWELLGKPELLAV